MPKFIALESAHIPDRYSNWTDAKKFNSFERIVPKDGHTYCLFAKKEQKYRFIKLRKLMGIILVGSTLGIALASKNVRRLFATSKSVRFGVRENPPENNGPQSSPFPNSTARSDLNVGQTADRSSPYDRAPAPRPSNPLASNDGKSANLGDPEPEEISSHPRPIMDSSSQTSEPPPENFDPASLRLSDIDFLFRNRENGQVDRQADPLPSLPDRLLPNAALPKLRSLGLAPDHPLMQPILLETFQEDVAGLPEPDLHVAFSTLLHIPLRTWLGSSFVRENHGSQREFQRIVAALDTRIEQLNQSVQLQERLSRLGEKQNITLQDLLEPWPTSQLRYELAMDDELQEMTLDDISSLPNVSFLDRLINTEATVLSSVRRNGRPLLTLVNLSVDQINMWGNTLPASAFFFVRISEELEIDNLWNEQVEVLLQAPGQAAKLTSRQVASCLQRNLTIEAWKNFTQEQIAGLNFSELDIDQDKFDCLFPEEADLGEKISHLHAGQIGSLRGFFRTAHWQALTDEQLAQVDFSEATDRNTFKVLFEDGLRHVRISRLQSMNANQILSLCRHFEREHWQALTEAQIAGINFDLLQRNASVFNFQQMARFIFDDNEDRAVASKIQSLTASQLYALAPALLDRHWRELTLEQIAQLDFTQLRVDREKYRSLFCDLHGSAIEEKIHSLNGAQISCLGQVFLWNDWRTLTEEQIAQLDFSRIALDRNKLSWIFGDANGEVMLSKFHCMNANQIMAACKYFKRKHWEALSAEQISQIDFYGLERNVNSARPLRCGEDENDRLFSLFYRFGRKVRYMFEGSDGVNKIHCLHAEQIYALHAHLFEKHWKALSLQQIMQLNFARFRMDHVKFTYIFCDPSDTLIIEKIQCLNAAQIDSLHRLFRAEHWQALTPEQKLAVGHLLPEAFR